MTDLILPEILKIPPKLYPMIENLNDFRYFLLIGGRASGKTQSVARWLLYLSEHRRVRVLAGREFQNSIEDSVYRVFADLIRQYNLNFSVRATQIAHNKSGSTIIFKGFREQGNINIKGLEGIDIVWIDEAQAITSNTLDVLIPTIRKEKAKIFFTMNPFFRDDPVPKFCANRLDATVIKINYVDNPYLSEAARNEAKEMQLVNEAEYRHIWLGEPKSASSDYLFNFAKLHAAKDIVPTGDAYKAQRVMAIDFAAGGDLCVASVIERKSYDNFALIAQETWGETDTMASVGRVVQLIAKWQPDITLLDRGGMGVVACDRLAEIGVKIIPFDGASTVGVNTVHYVNARAEAYYFTREWLDRGVLILKDASSDLMREMESIKVKHRSDGRRLIAEKQLIRKELGRSPDRADSLVMAVWGCIKYLGNTDKMLHSGGEIKRISKSGRSKHG